MKTIAEFNRKKDYLICIDSDGTVINSMDTIHRRCFGPCMVEIYGFELWEDEILKRWNEINLDTMTRGINRFQALTMALQEINRTITSIDGLSDLIAWTEETEELSNDSLEKALQKNPSSAMLQKVLQWSDLVNRRIQYLPESATEPFEGVKEALEQLQEYADIAIVSNADKGVVIEEWTMHGLLPYVDVVMAQDMGSKEVCIEELLKQGYERKKVLMLGDAPEDADAALACNILFYPVQIKKEKESWDIFRKEGFHKMITDSYVREYQKEQFVAFYKNLEKNQ